MQVSSDTIKSTSITISSLLRAEELDEILVMDWWFDSDMANRPSQPSASDKPLTRKQAEGLIRAELSKYQADAEGLAKTPKPFWHQSPWLIAGVTVPVSILGAFMIAKWQSSQTHSDEDQKRDIALDVKRQLEPINEELRKQGEQIANLRGNLGLSFNADPKIAIQQFSSLDAPVLGHHLVRLVQTLNEAQKKGDAADLRAVEAIQTKLATLDLNSTEAREAISAIINYASFVREKTELFPNAEAVRHTHCGFVTAPLRVRKNFLISNGTVDGCSQELDGFSFTNYTFENCIVIYRGGPLHLENVTFENCLFIVYLPVVQIKAPAKMFAREILAKSSGPRPTFTVTSG